ncbi:MAG: TetR/AcrR family transcriptional regulator [Desulfobacterales bacterium]
MVKDLSRRERKKLETRDRILSVAREMLASQGFEATTLDQIAEGSDVSNATFYNYFPNKDALLRKITEIEIEDIGQVIAQDTAHISSPLDMIRHAMELFYSDASPVLHVIRHVLLDRVMHAKTVPEPIAELNNHENVIEMIRQAQDQNELPSDIDPIQISESIAAAYLSASVFCKYLDSSKKFPKNDSYLTTIAMTLLKSIGIIDPKTPEWKPISDKLRLSLVSSK